MGTFYIGFKVEKHTGRTEAAVISELAGRDWLRAGGVKYFPACECGGI
jgi:hypothetical protein